MEKNALLQLGLSEKEADVYLLLVRLGPSAANTLARLSRIKRTSMYDVLSGLEKKHLIASFKQRGVAYFVVDDIKKLQQEQKEKLSISERLVETLKSQQGNFDGLHVQYYRGQAGYMEMYDDILEAKPEELIGWMDLDNFYTTIDAEYDDAWTEMRIKQGFKARLILQDSPLTRDFQKKDPDSDRETLLLKPGAFPYTSTCLLYNDYITFFDPDGEISGVRIHSAHLAELQRQVFEMCWTLRRN